MEDSPEPLCGGWELCGGGSELDFVGGWPVGGGGCGEPPMKGSVKMPELNEIEVEGDNRGLVVIYSIRLLAAWPLRRP